MIQAMLSLQKSHEQLRVNIGRHFFKEGDHGRDRPEPFVGWDSWERFILPAKVCENLFWVICMIMQQEGGERLGKVKHTFATS